MTCAEEDKAIVTIQLDYEDRKILVETLHTYLGEFRREVAGTENPDFRHDLEKRQVALERIVAALGG
jgi:hypothetical protein